jgi:hypothetical protein
MHDGILAAFATMAAIGAYVWFRYEWQFAAGALIADLDAGHLRDLPARLRPNGARCNPHHRRLLNQRQGGDL